MKRLAVITLLALVATVALTSCTVPSAQNQGPNPTTITTNVVSGVSYGPLASQVLDLHYPVGVTGPLPAVVYFHGGGFISGTRTDIVDNVKQLVPGEHVVLVSVDYRLATTTDGVTWTNSFPTQLNDADRAIRWVRANAAARGIDPTKIVVAGDSAGGTIASSVAALPGTFHDPTLTASDLAVSPNVAGLIDYVGPTNLDTWRNVGGYVNLMVAAYLNCPTAATCSPLALGVASPVNMVQTTPKPVPAYFAYGALDTLVPLQHQGDNMAQVWAIDRNDYAITPNDSRGTWYEGEDYADHYFNLANSNGLALALWLTKCLGGTI